MAIETTERWTGRGWRVTDTGYEAERFFDVSSSDPLTEDLAVSAVSVNVNDPHPYQTKLRAKNIGVAEIVGPRFFRINASYATPPNGQWAITHSLDPLSLPPWLHWERGCRSIPVDQDRGGIPFVNSAGDPLTPAMERPVVTRFLNYTRYEPFFDLTKAAAYEDHVNSDAFTVGPMTVAAGQSLCHSIIPEERYQTTADYIKITYRFEFDFSGSYPFQVNVIDKGQNGWVSDSGNKKGQICYSNGDPVSDDVLLDGTGKPVDASLQVLDSSGNPASPVVNPSIPSYMHITTSTPAKILVFQARASAAFLSLGL